MPCFCFRPRTGRLGFWRRRGSTLIPKVVVETTSSKDNIVPPNGDTRQESIDATPLPSPSSSGYVQIDQDGNPKMGTVEVSQQLKVPSSQHTKSETLNYNNQAAFKIGEPDADPPPNPEKVLHNASNDINHESISPELTLRHELCEARIERPEGSHRYFIPVDVLERLVTCESISKQLQGCLVSDEVQHHTAEHISKSATSLFAILVYLRHGHFIFDFLNEGIDDSHLPFIRSDNNAKAGNYKLCSSKCPGQLIKCMARWDRELVDDFGRDQWCMLAPIFEYNDAIEHYKLHDNCVLPWLEDEERSDRAMEGGYGSVWKIAIHPAHQRVRSNSNQMLASRFVALKRLHSANEQSFKSEVAMLRKLKKRKHAHLVNLLATFCHKGHFYLIFPYAHCNLRQYWEHTPIPDFTPITILWVLQECKAMASALHTVHESRSTHEPVNPYPAIQPSRTGVGASRPDDDDRLYGRHGDIKAENILWFPEDKDDSQGLLVIADFGLMAFHTKDTRSEVDAKHINGSPSYEPPELMLHSRISRAFDIWSLGCLYLEFTTWLVCGWHLLQRFPEARERSGYPSPEFHDDNFFTIIENEHRAEVRKSVRDWILDLHEMPRASEFVHDFLDFILKNLLVVDQAERIRMGQLNYELSNMLQRASRDPLYLTDPKPFRPRNVQQNPLSLAAFHQNGNTRSPNPQDGAPLPRRFSGVFDPEAPNA